MESSRQNQSTSEIVVCFMFDGSAKYGEMAYKAITSFQKSTPNIAVGLIVLPGADLSRLDNFIQSLPHPELIRTRMAQNHFNWNPTQYKLDLVEFADQFKTIFWLDSDTIIYNDMTEFLLKFHNSKARFAFARDHVNEDKTFRERWAGNKEKMFVAQACFMGFKSDHMREFFQEWEAIWREWITPVPFVRYADPFPSFPGSAFCIEQYALGMAIEKLIHNFDDAVFVIPRSQLILSPTGTSASLNNTGISNDLPRSDARFENSSAALTALFGSSSYAWSSASTSFLSSALSSALSSFALWTPSSYNSSFDTSYNTSYNTSAYDTSSALSSMFTSYGLEVMTSYFAGLMTSYESSARTFLESSYGSSFTSSYNTSYDTSYFASLASSSYNSSWNLPMGTSYNLESSYNSSATSYPNGISFGNESSQPIFGGDSSMPTYGVDLSRFRMVDNFAGNVLHYYSANYEMFKS